MEVIHIVLGKANPERMNGVNKVVYQLVSRQKRAGINARLWGFTHDLSVNFPERNFSTTLFPMKRSPFLVDPSFKAALDQLSPQETVFHLHGGWIPVFSSIAKALKKQGFRYVLTPHGAYNTVAMQKNSWKKKLYFQLFEKQLVESSAAVHCIGASEVTSLNSISPLAITVLIPYGMEFSRQQPATPAPEKFVFGFVGRLDTHTKGLDLMLEAFASHFRQHPAVELWIIGDGADKASLIQKINQLNLRENVVLLGPRYGAEKDELIRKMNIFLHPSRNEGMPSAVLEAAALGVPCIVTEATNVGTYLRQYQAGFTVPNEDVPNLAKIMAYCANAPFTRLSAMGLNASRMVTQQFNWSDIIRQFNQLYV